AESLPEDAEVRRTLGDAYYQSGSPALAIPHFEKALELAGPDVPILNALGACYAASGDAARAIPILEQSLRQSPGQKPVEELLSKLRSRSDPNR
ncbi:MAG TPA: tetratricopeptide repeat protein, partial [Vicinamibacteria bacterium]|nr:tetratricopeptide repeat protein [Vicinamibacteria bacterium]